MLVQLSVTSILRANGVLLFAHQLVLPTAVAEQSEGNGARATPVRNLLPSTSSQIAPGYSLID